MAQLPRVEGTDLEEEEEEEEDDWVPPPEWTRFLERMYFDPRQPGSFQGPQKLHQSIGKQGRYQLGINRLRQWLQNQREYSKNKLFLPHTIERARVIVSGMYDQWDADLLDMQKYAERNNEIRYLLVVIDVFSRYLWIKPLKNKENHTVKSGFEEILFETQRTPRRIRTDFGKEFVGKVMKAFFDTNNITHFVAMGDMKANYAERVNKTIKSKIVRFMNFRGDGRYIDVLDDLVHSYNNTYHRSIRMTPAEVTGNNESVLWWMQYRPRGPPVDINKPPPTPHYNFAIGDHVRIPKIATVFGKEYDERWTEEIFTIWDRFQRDNINMYKVKDSNDEIVYGSFYEAELQQVLEDQDNQWRVESVEKIYMNPTTGQREQAYVKFIGWGKEYNRWIPYDLAQRQLQARQDNNLE